MRRLIQTDAYSRRLWGSSREVVLALAVTIAALIFIFAVSQPQPTLEPRAEVAPRASSSK